jgi:short-subunit dehydrogenase
LKNYILLVGATSELANSLIKKLSVKNNLILLSSKNIAKANFYKNKNQLYLKYDRSLGAKKKLVSLIKKKKINISSIIHFSGLHSFLPIKNISLRDFRKMYEVNCFSFIDIVKLMTSDNLSSNLRSIVTISSVASMSGNKGISLYSASKSSLNNIVRSFALELSGKKIRVNSIVLGHINLGMGKKTTKFLNKEQMKNLENKHPLGFGKAEDLTNSIEFLIDSKKSRWITGVNFILDGGYLA